MGDRCPQCFCFVRCEGDSLEMILEQHVGILASFVLAGVGFVQKNRLLGKEIWVMGLGLQPIHVPVL